MKRCSSTIFTKYLTFSIKIHNHFVILLVRYTVFCTPAQRYEIRARLRHDIVVKFENYSTEIVLRFRYFDIEETSSPRRFRSSEERINSCIDFPNQRKPESIQNLKNVCFLNPLHAHLAVYSIVSSIRFQSRNNSAVE